MSRRRRSNINASSLDLFLDTICNAFGGIIFLSILIAVLAKMQDSRQSSKPSNENTPQSEVDEFSRKLKELQSDRRRIVTTIDSLEKLRGGADQSEVIELKEQIRQANRRLDQAVAEQALVSLKLSEVQVDVTNRKQESAELEEKLVAAQAAYLDKAKAVDDALDSRVQKTELPSVRATNKGNLLMAMRYGKLYLISDPTDRTSGKYNTPHAIITKTPFSTDVKPKKEAGWDLSVATDVSQLELALANQAPHSIFLSVAVWPDSFKEFARLKENCLRLGYDYQLLPLNDVESISIGSGGSASVQ